MPTHPTHPALVALRERLNGTLLLPEDVGYDAARRPWNLSIEQRPDAVASPADVDDLRALLVAARESGASLAVQPSGHGASGSLEGAVLVRMSAFDELTIDRESGIARVGAGVRWGAVVEALEGTGWVAPAGTSPVVSVAGYTLGGWTLVVQPHSRARIGQSAGGLGTAHGRLVRAHR